MTNFLALEDPIKTRLRESLDAAGHTSVRVLSAPDIGEIDILPAPCVVLVFDGYRLPDGNTSARAVRVAQTWLAVVVVRSAATVKSGEASRAKAGELASIALSALMAWRPDGGSKPLALLNPPAASYESGLFYLPLAVEAEFIHSANPQ